MVSTENIFVIDAKLTQKAEQLKFYQEHLKNLNKVIAYSSQNDTIGVVGSHYRYRDEVVEHINQLKKEMDELLNRWVEKTACNLGLFDDIK